MTILTIGFIFLSKFEVKFNESCNDVTQINSKVCEDRFYDRYLKIKRFKK